MGFVNAIIKLRVLDGEDLTWQETSGLRDVSLLLLFFFSVIFCNNKDSVSQTGITLVLTTNFQCIMFFIPRSIMAHF
jgi:hypothetical protein